MYFHESEGRVKILLTRVQHPILHGNLCNKRFILYSHKHGTRISVSTQYLTSEITFCLLYCVLIPFTRSLSFSDYRLYLRPTIHVATLLGYYSATTNFSHNFSQLPLVVAMRMVATAHAYYNMQYGRILHSCSMEHLYYAHLEYKINSSIGWTLKTIHAL